MRRSLPLAATALVLAGCGTGTVERTEVEKQAQAGLTRAVGQPAPPAKCPEALKAEKGATTRCTMDFPGDQRLGITVRVTSVDGDRVNFDIRADEKPTRTP